jgi:hypothetical protein
VELDRLAQMCDSYEMKYGERPDCILVNLETYFNIIKEIQPAIIGWDLIHNGGVSIRTSSGDTPLRVDKKAKEPTPCFEVFGVQIMVGL